MTQRWILVGLVSNEAISRNGLVLVHDNPDELEWLFYGVKVKPIGDNFGLPTLPIRELPEFEGVHWPIRRSEFRDYTTRTRER